MDYLLQKEDGISFEENGKLLRDRLLTLLEPLVLVIFPAPDVKSGWSRGRKEWGHQQGNSDDW